MAMTNAHDTLLGLIRTLYAAPGSTDGWMAFLREIRRHTDASGAHFIALARGHDLNPRSNVSITTFDSEEGLADYHAYWGRYDPWGQSAGLDDAPAQTVILGDELVPHAAFKRTGYYQDFARYYDLCRGAFGLVDGAAARSRCLAAGGGAAAERVHRDGPHAAEECVREDRDVGAVGADGVAAAGGTYVQEPVS